MATAQARNIQLSPEIINMGFSGIQILAKNMIIKHQDGLTLLANYDAKDLIKTTKLLEGQLAEHIGQPIGLPKEFNIKAFTAALSIALMQDIETQHTQKQGEQQKEKQREQAILNEINELKKQNAAMSFEGWRQKLLQKYKDLQSIIKEKMPEIWPGLEYELSVMQILKIQGNTLPFIGIILGRPSSYKTVVIELVKGYANTYYTDNFTGKSFVTHTTAIDSVEELEQKDMIPKMINRLVLTPELSPIFSMKDEDLNLVLGIMTRLADGEGYSSDSGAHGHRGYEDDVMFTWVGAAVDIPYKVYKILSNLGAKIYFYRTYFKDETPSELLEYAKKSHEFNARKQQIKDTLYDYLKWLDMGHDLFKTDLQWDTQKDDEEALRYIVNSSDLLSYMRCNAKVWETHDTQGSEYAYSISQREVPRRAITALTNLAKGHALLEGRNHITLDDITLVIKTAMDTAQIERVSIFSLLLAHDGVLTTTQILEFLNISRPTALRTMAEFKAIGLVSINENSHDAAAGRPEKCMVLNPRFDWFLTDKLIKKISPHIPTNFFDYGNGNGSGNGHGKQEDLFWKIYDELEAEEQRKPENIREIDRNTVNYTELHNRLLLTGEYLRSDVDFIINQMIDAGRLERPMENTYRKVAAAQK
jgi:hypothetical protein